MKNLIKKAIKRTGFTLVKNDVLREMRSRIGSSENTMINALYRLKNRNTQFKTIIDVGAAEGVWSLKAHEVFPHAYIAMVEPLSERQDVLNKLCTTQNNFHFINCALGKENGEVYFTVTEDLDGSAISSAPDTKSRKVQVSRLDDILSERNLEGPYLLKLDTHGFEVPILEGATSTLKSTDAVIIECYGFHVASESLLFHEMCSYMEKLGFRLADIVDNLYRPGDEFLWQIDAVFVPASNKSFLNNRYM